MEIHMKGLKNLCKRNIKFSSIALVWKPKKNRSESPKKNLKEI